MDKKLFVIIGLIFLIQFVVYGVASNLDPESDLIYRLLNSEPCNGEECL